MAVPKPQLPGPLRTLLFPSVVDAPAREPLRGPEPRPFLGPPNQHWWDSWVESAPVQHLVRGGYLSGRHYPQGCCWPFWRGAGSSPRSRLWMGAGWGPARWPPATRTSSSALRCCLPPSPCAMPSRARCMPKRTTRQVHGPCQRAGPPAAPGLAQSCRGVGVPSPPPLPLGPLSSTPPFPTGPGHARLRDREPPDPTHAYAAAAPLTHAEPRPSPTPTPTLLRPRPSPTHALRPQAQGHLCRASPVASRRL